MTRFLPVFLVVAALFVFAPDAQAQQRGGFGIGGQIGDPTGLALKFGSGTRFDLAAGWDLDEYLFVQGHLLLAERPIPGANAPLTYYYGPGAFIGIPDNGDALLGASFNIGGAYYTGQIEIFLQATPRLLLVPETDFDIGVALGLRYYP